MKLSAKLPPDDQGAKLMRFENVRGQRYTEIFLIGGHAITRHLVGGVYNTPGLNDPTGTGDTSPQAVLDKVDVDDLKEKYDLLGAFKNGPRLWTLDWVEVMVGAQRDFHGLKARWVMWLDVPKQMRKHESVAYQEISGKRDTQLGINKGSPAFLLDDPAGDSWCMKSASLIVDPNQTYQSLKDLGSRLKPAPGWNFRAIVLGQDLVLTTDDGAAKITQDELGNTYDRVGGPCSNYKPSSNAGQYGTDYEQRAMATLIGPGLNSPQDAIYLFSEEDVDGHKYDGAKHAYVMRFAEGQMPPVKGFWSLTMYDADFFFVPNPIDRNSLSQRDTFVTNDDGSVDLYVQAESPGPDEEPNWLLAPEGKFIPMLQLYWPEDTSPSLLDGSWTPPRLLGAT